MSTIVNNPNGGNGTDSGTGLVLGIVIALILIILFVVYGLPAIRGNNADNTAPSNINVTVPRDNNPTPAPTVNNYNSTTTINTGVTATSTR